MSKIHTKVTGASERQDQMSEQQGGKKENRSRPTRDSDLEGIKL